MKLRSVKTGVSKFSVIIKSDSWFINPNK